MNKKVFCIILVLTVCFSLTTVCSAAGIPSVTDRLKITNYAYAPYVANVYTAGNPSSGIAITLYTASGSNCQSWKNIQLISTPTKPAYSYEYRIACYYEAYQNLVMNYNQSTTLCTLYNFNNDPIDDYAVYYLYGEYDTVIVLSRRTLFLGASGSGNGASMYWYDHNYASASDNWVITAW